MVRAVSQERLQATTPVCHMTTVLISKRVEADAVAHRNSRRWLSPERKKAPTSLYGEAGASSFTGSVVYRASTAHTDGPTLLQSGTQAAGRTGSHAWRSFVRPQGPTGCIRQTAHTPDSRRTHTRSLLPLVEHEPAQRSSCCRRSCSPPGRGRLRAARTSLALAASERALTLVLLRGLLTRPQVVKLPDHLLSEAPMPRARARLDWPDGHLPSHGQPPSRNAGSEQRGGSCLAGPLG